MLRIWLLLGLVSFALVGCSPLEKASTEQKLTEEKPAKSVRRGLYYHLFKKLYLNLYKDLRRERG